MTGKTDKSPPGEAGGEGRGSALIKYLLAPLLVLVLGALLVAAFAPGGVWLREWIFPTKATVSGTVRIGGTPASDAQLALDGEPVAKAAENGAFLLDEVGRGTHELLLRKVGARQRIVPFKVHHGDAEVKLNSIELEPLVQLRYAYDESQAGAAVRYDLSVWIAGKPEAMRRVRSVTYTLPDWAGKAPQSGAPAQSFCYRTRGDVLAQPGLDPALADVTLRNGDRFRIAGYPNLPGGPPRPACPFSPPPPPEGPRHLVPGVIGQSFEAASSTLQAAGFTVTRTDVDSNEPKGIVVGQSPGPGANEAQSATISLRVAKGPTPVVTVPDVTGQSFEAASSTLQAAGFTVTRTDVDSNEPKGIVVAQNPEPGTNEAPVTRVTLSVSKGPPTLAEVPNVTGHSRDDATEKLRDSGFRSSVASEAVADPSLDDVVVAQDPPGGVQAPNGSTVALIVGTYSHP